MIHSMPRRVGRLTDQPQPVRVGVDACSPKKIFRVPEHVQNRGSSMTAPVRAMTILSRTEDTSVDGGGPEHGCRHAPP
jgi:hypothetical protein